MQKYFIFILLNICFLYGDVDYYQEFNNTKVYLTRADKNKLKQLNLPSKAIRWYFNDEKILLGLKNRFFIDASTLNDFSKILKDYNLTKIRKFKKELYLVETKNDNVLSIIDNINRRYNHLIAHPNFYKKVMKR
jgi:hypothetical protein